MRRRDGLPHEPRGRLDPPSQRRPPAAGGGVAGAAAGSRARAAARAGAGRAGRGLDVCAGCAAPAGPGPLVGAGRRRLRGIVTACASFRALGTTATVLVCDTRALPLARCLLAEELACLDRACSRFRDDSELAHANAHAGEWVQVSSLLAEAVRVALAAADSSGGLVAPTLGASLRAAGYDRTFALVRARDGWSPRAVRPAPEAWREVELDEERRELRVPSGVELDLGATAKALAADRAAAQIAAETRTGTLVSLGGDIAVAGSAPATGWPVRIGEDHAEPLDGDGPVVAVTSGGLATSSTSARTWPTDAGPAHHVLDPRTGRPAATPWRTVSVAAASCVDANVAATGALVAGDAAPAWLERRRVHARLVTGAGEVVLVGEWPSDQAAAA